MRMTLALTLDGMVRALRMKAHMVAEDVEDGYRRRQPREVLTRHDVRRDEAERANDRAGD
ncbi:MAG: hypothetical protein K5872_04560 [Rhizobiaceae bacterium]|nr:hypothetical protein [Rhizobiaceae bacterium]MCV0405483.1 hypothetical protein [Rhizobiaceae bacterium]